MSSDTLPTAALWRRFAALMYDLFILVALSMAYGAVTTVIYAAANGSGTHDYSPMMGGWLFRFGWALTLAFFYIYFWLRAGQTVGMKAWRIKLISIANDSEKLTLKQCCLRAIFGPLALAPLALGYFWAWFDRSRDCLHDRFSATRVVLTPKLK